MCGILGLFKDEGTIIESNFNKLRDTLKHRGPDGFDSVFFENNKIALGHRRLSIIDLTEKGKQPISNLKKTVWLTYNGEIYNYKFLKKELQDLGYNFKSKTDSEVLVYAYEEWGLDLMLSKLKGMFAFAIWDSLNQKLFLVRDRFGIKPLYYGKINGDFIFASELKAIHLGYKNLLRIKQTALGDFFNYGYIPEPNTIWQDIYKIEPGSYLEYSYKSKSIRKKTYWNLNIENRIMPYHRVQEKANKLIENTIKDHLVSDVPVGLFLSGGYDSSTILMRMKKYIAKPMTYTVGFKNSDRSEHTQAAEIAKAFKVKNKLKLIEPRKNYQKVTKELLYYFDEPFSISSMIPYYLISKEASEDLKVCLVGDGGDEVFAGYLWQHKIVKEFSKGWKGYFKINRQSRLIKAYASYMPGTAKQLMSKKVFNKEFNTILKKNHNDFYKKNFKPSKDILKTIQYLDFRTFITGPNLTRADRTSMANSLELRVPFLDHEIFEFFFSLNSKCYHQEGVKKKILHEPLSAHLPSEVLNMPKRGFSFQFLKDSFSDIQDVIDSSKIHELGIFSKPLNVQNLSPEERFQLFSLAVWTNNYL